MGFLPNIGPLELIIVLVIVVMIFRPRGLWPHRAVERVRRRLRSRSGPYDAEPPGSARPPVVAP